MKQLLSISLLVLAMSACQSQSAKNETVTTPTPNGVSPVVSDQNNLTTERPDKNPAHGLPYHDCGIPVGAPLVAVQLPAQNGTPAQPEMQIPPTAVKGAKLNPAHGQPGHRCDIQVGAPLL